MNLIGSSDLCAPLITRCAPFPTPRSIVRAVLPRLPQSPWPCPNWDCSRSAQSGQCKFDEGLPFARGLDGSTFGRSGAVAKPPQMHLRILDGGDSSHKPAMNQGALRIRIYSFICQNPGHNVFVPAELVKQTKGFKKRSK